MLKHLEDNTVAYPCMAPDISQKKILTGLPASPPQWCVPYKILGQS